MTPARAAQDFEARLRAGLADAATNATFERVGAFLRSLKTSALAQACLARYLELSTKLENDRNRSRSDAAFYLALRRVLDLAKPDELDAWSGVLTQQQRPFSPLRARFEALGKTDAKSRGEILELVNAPKKRRAEKASVLDELKGSFARANARPARGLEELLAHPPLPNDTGLRRGYGERLAALRLAYDGLRSNDQDRLTTLRAEIEAFWSFVREQRNDGLRLFQLLHWWRSDRNPKPSVFSPPDEIDYLAYTQLVAGLLQYAVGDRQYAANVGARSFTTEEWRFVLPPLQGRRSSNRYFSTYKSLLARYFTDVPSFPRQCELFLRLMSFATSTGAELARNEDMAYVVRQLQATSAAELRKRSFKVGEGVQTRWYVKDRYRIGQQIGTKLTIIYFEGATPKKVYVEFADARGVLFSVPFATFVGYAEGAPYDVIYENTKGLLTLIPLLFEVLVALPGVVQGGFVGLISALLDQVEDAVVTNVLEAFGVDPDQSGLWAMGASLLLHRPDVGSLRPKVRGLEELPIGEAQFARAIDAPATTTATRALDAPHARAIGEVERGLEPIPARAIASPDVTVSGQMVPSVGAAPARSVASPDARMLGKAERGAEATAARAVDAPADTRMLGRAERGAAETSRESVTRAAHAAVRSEPRSLAREATVDTPPPQPTSTPRKKSTTAREEAEQPRAELVSARQGQGRGTQVSQRTGAAEPDDAAKGATQSTRATGSPATGSRATGSRSVPPSPPPTPHPPRPPRPRRQRGPSLSGQVDDARTAGTGAIESIERHVIADGSQTVIITGELRPSIRPRSRAPNFNNEPTWARLRNQHGLQGWEAAHLWGPGFGDEAAAGIMLASFAVNRIWQNPRVERFLREDLRELAAAATQRGTPVSIRVRAEARSHPGTVAGGHALAEVKYTFSAITPHGEVPLGRMDLNIDPPPLGTPSLPEITRLGGNW